MSSRFGEPKDLSVNFDANVSAPYKDFSLSLRGQLVQRGE